MKKIILLLLLLVILFCLYVMFNTFTFKSHQLEVPAISPTAIPEGAVNRFAEAVTIRTISFEDQADFDSSQFMLFNQFLKNKYVLADSLLEHQTINEFSHLYRWRGSDPSLKPMILMAHLDVVPIASLRKWSVHPFTEGIKDGIIYGRGTMDDKFSLVAIMESVEQLLAEGYQPQRTVYLSFGHDEEALGKYGAIAIVEYLKDQGIEAEFVIDEGQAIVSGMIPGVENEVGLIGIAEKGYASLELRVDMAGGHSSTPAEETSIDVLSAAVYKVKSRPFPASITPAMDGLIDRIGAEMPFRIKLAFANKSLFKSSILKGYEEVGGAANASIRTTIAPTIFESGIKENVIPTSARAVINFRILPGETTESVKAYVKESINDERVQLEFVGYGGNPSPVSPSSGFGYDVIDRSIKEVFPNVLTSPSLVVAATDSRHFAAICPNVYRFAPYHINPKNLSCFHGIDERVAVSEFEDGIRFYRRIILNGSE